MLDKRPIAKARLLLEMAHRLLQEEYNSLDAQYPDMSDHGWRHNEGWPGFSRLSDAIEYNQITLGELDSIL